MMQHLKPLFCVVLLLSFQLSPWTSRAQGGMWLPAQLQRQEADMQKLGLKIPVSDIYSDSGNALNNAVVIFGNGCTGEMVSPNGLLFTNHHCGFGTVQGLSTPQHNYLTDGFWAKGRQDEIPCPGLKVTFIRSMQDVTKQVLANINDSMDESTRKRLIHENINSIATGYAKITGLEAVVKSFYNGNQYMVVLTEVYRDVRLVAYPPNAIGQFGGDTDNWMWPQEKGDFSVFRVYASKDNKPADYNPQNVPYQPKRYLTISTKGYQEGDLSMVYGFPYITQEYITSFELSQLENILYPIRIAARGSRMEAWNAAMQGNTGVYLKYAAKYSGVSNGYKKMQGALKGMQLNNVIAIKQAYENDFQKAAVMDDKDPSSRMLLSKMQALIEANNDLVQADAYTYETVMSIEAIRQAEWLQKVLDLYRSHADAGKTADSLHKLKASMAGFYKNYDATADKSVFESLMAMYMNQEAGRIPPGITELLTREGNNYEQWANDVYGHTLVTDAGKMSALFNSPADTIKIKADPAYRIFNIVSEWNSKKIQPGLKVYEARLKRYNREYMKYQLAYNVSGKNMYPDANQTLRLSYGPVKGITPIGSDTYSYYTTIDDAMLKYDPESTEFNIPHPLIDIYMRHDFGKWEDDSTIPANFITVNHTSGGNSGSPVLNAKGELIGLNFDRIWDGTMSDHYFAPAYCRNVVVDIRYVLFLIDKYGQADWILKELKFAK